MPDYFTREGDEYKPVTLKLMPETDFMAFKVKAESTQSELSTALEAAKTTLDTMTVRATEAETALTGVKAELEPLKDISSKVSTLEAELAASKEQGAAAQGQMLTQLKTSLQERIKHLPDAVKKLEGMTTLTEVQAFEETTKLLGIAPPQQNGQRSFDRNSNNTDNRDSSMSPRSRIANALGELTATPGGGGNP